MKKIYTFLILLLPFTMMAQTNFSGNGASGFGGGVGNGTLTVSDDATKVSFSFTGPGFSGNNLVIYVDNNTGGGIASTSVLTDNADGGRTAISGFKNPERTTVNFPTAFRPQLAISLAYDFAGLFNLSTPSSFGFVSGGGLVVTGNTLTFSFTKSALGIVGAPNFKFFGTLISPSAFRSNEALGITSADPISSGGNPGFTGAISPTTFFTYSNSVLPLSILNLSGSKSSAITELRFVTSDETSISAYTIQASADQFSWTTIATLSSRYNSNGSNYTYTDNRNVKGTQFYRVRAQDMDGSFKFSNILLLKGSGGPRVQILGNIINSQIKFAVSDDEKDKMEVSIISAEGRVVGKSSVQHISGYATYTLNAGNLSTGMYFIQFRSADGSVQTEKIIKQ